MNGTQNGSPHIYVIVTLLAAVISAATHILVAYITHSLPPRPTVPGYFGESEPVAFNFPKKAETDGFIVVNSYKSHGPSGVKVMVERGTGDSRICARFQGPYQSTVCPVARGDSWEVRTSTDGSGLSARWLPIEEVPTDARDR